MKKKLGLLLLLALTTVGAGAQRFDGTYPGTQSTNDDFGLGMGVSIEQNLGVKGLSAELDLSLRTRNSASEVDRWSVGLGLGYTICPYLKVGASYAHMYGPTAAENKPHYKEDDLGNAELDKNGNPIWNGYNRTNSYWRNKNRVAIDLKTGFDFGRFSFSLRERYQLTDYRSANVDKDKYRYKVYYADDDVTPKFFVPKGYQAILDADDNLYGVFNKETGELLDYVPACVPERELDHKGHKTKEYLRSKAEVSYNIRHCPVTPSVSVEFSNNLREQFALDKVRYAAGLDWKITKKVHVAADYYFNKGQDDDNEGDLHLVEVSLKLKNIFFNPKKK